MYYGLREIKNLKKKKKKKIKGGRVWHLIPFVFIQLVQFSSNIDLSR